MKVKKIVAIAVVSTMIIGCVSQIMAEEQEIVVESITTAEDYLPLTDTSADYEYTELEDGTLCLTKYNGAGGDVVIPNMIDGKMVTKIGGLFKWCDCIITSVKIPASVISIDSLAFYNCTQLTDIIVDENNTVYSSVDGVLYDNYKTKVIECPDGKKGAVLIVEGTESIQGGAFSRCNSITSIMIPSSIIQIGNLDIGGATAFMNCDLLSEINVSEDNLYFSSANGILYNKNKSSLIKCPEMIKGTIEIPDSVNYIEHYAFNGCSLITSVIIPSNVRNIGYYAFSGCSSITSITIPTNVTNLIRKSPDKNSIYYGIAHPFANCTSLTDVNISEENSEYKSVDGVVYSKDGTKLLIYPAGRKGNYEIPNGVVEIEDMAFHSNKFISLIAISNGVETIGTEALTECDSLKTVIIPESVTNIDYSFSQSYDFTVYGVIGSYANQYADEERLKFVDISTVHIDKLNGIILQLYDKATVDNTELKVISVETDLDNTVIYDITLLDKNGNQIQPKENTTVKITLPFSYDANIKVYRKEANNRYTDMNASYSDGYMVFTTDHFSEYVVTAKNLAPKGILGDINNDTKVTIADARMLLQAASGSRELTDEQKAVADINDDGKITIVDARWLLQVASGSREL